MGPRLLRVVIYSTLLLGCAMQAAAAKRVLLLTATAGFRHGPAIDAAVQLMQELARESGVLEITHTEDVSLISAANLANYDAVYFLTSGELPFSAQQKTDLLNFVRQGKGFVGSHAATDTLYSWPEYGELIGGYFDEHPWTQEAAVDVEDPQNPIVAHMSPGFRVLEEYYQFQEFSRERVRVLLTLDTRTVDLNAEGVKRTDGDFALAWIRNYGQGRVFYSAFGHFPENFQNQPFRTMILKALLWVTREIEADATPRSGPSSPAPVVRSDGVRNLGGGEGLAPGSVFAISGQRLTSGSTLGAGSMPLPVRLAGTHVEVNGIPAPLYIVTPEQIVAQLPLGLTAGTASLRLASVNRAAEPVTIRIETAAPEILGAVRVSNAIVLYVVGLGATTPEVPEGAAAPVSPLARTVVQPVLRVGGQQASIFYSGLSPGWAGLYQVNAYLPDGAAPLPDGAFDVVLEAGGRVSNTIRFRP